MKNRKNPTADMTTEDHITASDGLAKLRVTDPDV